MAAKGVTDRTCPDCRSPMKENSSKYGRYWDCTGPNCTWRMKEDGTGADRPTRAARIRAHIVFDALWRRGTISRDEAYHWLRKTMDLSEEQGHIAKMTKEQCELLIEKVKDWY